MSVVIPNLLDPEIQSLCLRERMCVRTQLHSVCTNWEKIAWKKERMKRQGKELFLRMRLRAWLGI